MEDMGNLFGYERWGIAYGEERLDEVGGVGVKVFRMAANSLDSQNKGDGTLGG